MELQLHRIEFTQVGPISGKHELVVFPGNEKKKRQKLCVGDDNGNISCIGLEKGRDIVWQKKSKEGSGISRLELGGVPGARDNVFTAGSHQVQGWSRKGKDFFKLVSNSVDNISAMAIDDTKLFLATDLMLNMYDNGRDKYYYMCEDKINDICLLSLTKELGVDAFLGCQDRALRVVRDGLVSMEMSCEGPIECVVDYTNSSGGEYKNILYGTNNGKICQIIGTKDGLQAGWIIPNEENSNVLSLETYDFTHSDQLEILVGRDNGNIQILSFSIPSEAAVLYESNLGESIRGIGSGCINDIHYEDLCICTYSGRIITLTSQPLQVAAGDSSKKNKATVMRDERINQLQLDIKDLETQIEKEKQKIQKSGKKYTQVKQTLSVSHSILLDPEKSCYVVTLEIPTPIDSVLLRSENVLDILDSNSTTFTVSKTEGDAYSKTLVNYKCQEVTNRFELRYRTIEGSGGILNLYVTSKSEPKVCNPIEIEIKPLSLHHRVRDMSPVKKNDLTITGKFRANQIHDWISHILPDVPPRMTNSDMMELTYQNAYVGTVLYCRYREGEAYFLSDSISTLSIIRDTITNLATERKILVGSDYHIDEESINYMLELIHQKLDYQILLVKKNELIDPLKEITQQEDSIDFLELEYQEVLKNVELIQSEYDNRTTALHSLCGIISDLYVDYNKYKGKNVIDRIPLLQRLIDDDYSLENLIAFFENKYVPPNGF